jgi:hypothetical protein
MGRLFLYAILVSEAIFALPAHAQFSSSYIYTDTNDSTAIGVQALGYDVTNETGSGCDGVTVCYDNTAAGAYALNGNTTGDDNSAFGVAALEFNTTGSSNNAVGYEALHNNTTGNDNTAIGHQALFGNDTTGTVTGNNNTAMGYHALFFFTSGSADTATGWSALYSNSTGSYNTATGQDALYSNSSGQQNTASGAYALYSNTTGGFNTASGLKALYYNKGGKSNIAVGYEAGFNLTTGSNNIDIGNLGSMGESGTIRIGTTSTQTATYIAGIYNVTTLTSGLPVVIDASGQLGTTSSSERFKTAIAPMGSNTAKLQQLRPVTFHYKADPKGMLRYGLIAEEVAKVYPELVVRDGTGRIDGVRYDELAPMLLNEMQKNNAAQDQHNAIQAAEIRALKQEVSELKALNQATQAALQELEAKQQLIAQR